MHPSASPKAIKEEITRDPDNWSSHGKNVLDHGGFKAWLANFLATERKFHFKGRHRRSLIIADFEKVSQDKRIRMAQKLAALQPHQTADKAIHKMHRCLSNIGNDDPMSFPFLRSNLLSVEEEATSIRFGNLVKCRNVIRQHDLSHIKTLGRCGPIMSNESSYLFSGVPRQEEGKGSDLTKICRFFPPRRTVRNVRTDHDYIDSLQVGLTVITVEDTRNKTPDDQQYMILLFAHL